MEKKEEKKDVKKNDKEKGKKVVPKKENEVSKKEETKKEEKKEVKEKVEKETKEEAKKEEKVTKPKEEKKKTPSKSKEGMSKETKDKIFKGVGVTILVLAILGMAFWVSSSYGDNSKPYEFTYIDIDKYLEYLNGSEAKIIYVARPDCSFCQQESPIIKKLASKYDLPLYYLDTTNFVEKDENGTYRQDEKGNPIYTETGKKFIASATEYKDGWGTPNTIIVKDGKIIDGVYQYVDESELKSLFKNNGFI